jgi:hypothetical protein
LQLRLQQQDDQLQQGVPRMDCHKCTEHALSHAMSLCTVLSVLQLQARQQLDDAALQELELMLEEAAAMGLAQGEDPAEPRINYDVFTQVRAIRRSNWWCKGDVAQQLLR